MKVSTVVGKNKLISFITSNSNYSNWFMKILWWEIMRIPFNLITILILLVGIYISHITILFLYIILLMILNIIFCLTWMIEIFDKPQNQGSVNLIKHRKNSFKTIIVITGLIIFLCTVIPLAITLND